VVGEGRDNAGDHSLSGGISLRGLSRFVGAGRGLRERDYLRERIKAKVGRETVLRGKKRRLAPSVGPQGKTKKKASRW